VSRPARRSLVVLSADLPVQVEPGQSVSRVHEKYCMTMRDKISPPWSRWQVLLTADSPSRKNIFLLLKQALPEAHPTRLVESDGSPPFGTKKIDA
jgi:hypothetical protein